MCPDYHFNMTLCRLCRLCRLLFWNPYLSSFSSSTPGNLGGSGFLIFWVSSHFIILSSENLNFPPCIRYVGIFLRDVYPYIVLTFSCSISASSLIVNNFCT